MAAQQNGTLGFLIAGTYDIRIQSQAGWVATTPVVSQVTIKSGTVIRIPFGNFKLGTIAGRVLEFTLHLPANDPGKLPTDTHGLPGRVVYLDSNNNGRLDGGESSTTTSDVGRYLLTGVGPGPQHVANVLPPGWIAVPGDAEQEITIASGVQYEYASYLNSRDDPRPGSYFLNKRIGAVTGRVLDGGDAGLAGVVVFFDVNNDGVLSAGEGAAVTDDLGAFVLTRPIHDARDNKAQPFTLRLQIPFGLQMDEGEQSFRVIEVPAQTPNSLNVFDFEVSRFKLIPQQQFDHFIDTFDRPASSILGDAWAKWQVTS